jgi:hypothetical protein
VKQKIDSEVQNWWENERNKEHDKIIQYFPQFKLHKAQVIAPLY